MTYDAVSDPTVRTLQPVDQEASRRATRLRELGLGLGPDEEFDAFAQRVAEAAGGLIGTRETALAFVNLITDRQHITGLYVAGQGAGPATVSAGAVDLREGARDFGFCPHVVARRKALVLDDVCDYPRFVGNPIVDQLGIRTYLGAPLIDRTGTTLGTVCVVDREPRPWGHLGLNFIKERAAELMQQIHRREELRD
ncbi:MAG: GAF domain-containing protein [Actinoallomurus sp.]